MGHWCRICGRTRPNEKFSGKGHARHICRQCSKLPREEIQRKEDENALFRLFHQSRISPKNIRMLEAMCEKHTGRLKEQVEAAIQLARIRPHKKKRLGYNYHHYRELFDRLVKLRLIEDRMTPLIEGEEAAATYYNSLESDDMDDAAELDNENWSGENLSEDEDYDDLPF